MEKLKRLALTLCMAGLTTASFAGELPKEKETKPVGLPDVLISVPGTPFFRTAGEKGFAIECRNPFDRVCLIFIMKGSVTDQNITLLKSNGTVLPSSLAPMIEEGSQYIGLRKQDGSGYEYYRMTDFSVHNETGVLTLDIPFEIKP